MLLFVEKKGIKQTWSQFKRTGRHSESSVSTTPDKPMTKKKKIIRIKSSDSDADIDIISKKLLNNLNDVEIKQQQPERSTAPQPRLHPQHRSTYLQVPQHMSWPFGVAPTTTTTMYNNQEQPPSRRPPPPLISAKSPRLIPVHHFTATDTTSNATQQNTENLLNESTQSTSYVSERNPEWKKRATGMRSRRQRRRYWRRGGRRRYLPG